MGGLVSDITGVGTLAQAAEKIIGMFKPDATAVEHDAAMFQLQTLMDANNIQVAQIGVDQAEAQSTDPMQHWRGALGWVCTLAYAWNFILQPVASYTIGLLNQYEHLVITVPGAMDISLLSALTTGMLGLAAAHVTERVKGAT